MATRPTTDDLIGWLSLQSGPADEVRSNLDACLAASLESIEGRVTITDGYPQAVRLAVILMAARLFKRIGTPDGVRGVGELGVVTVTGIDADVENLIDPFLTLTGFF